MSSFFRSFSNFDDLYTLYMYIHTYSTENIKLAFLYEVYGLIIYNMPDRMFRSTNAFGKSVLCLRIR